MSLVPVRPTTTAAGWNAHDIAQAIGARVVCRGGADETSNGWVGAATNDTGSMPPRGIFVALQGARSHGIEHWRAAVTAGAAAILIGSDAPGHLVAQLEAELPAGVVAVVSQRDAVTALGDVARAWRQRCGFQMVGITGSSGKTTCKDLLRELLSARFDHVVASTANHNNEIGVPLTILSAKADTDVVLCEMGMRGPGQISYLCDIARPDVGIVTNAGTAHLELLGSRQEIARAKAEIFAGTSAAGTAVCPSDQRELLELACELPDQILTFGIEDTATVRILSSQREADGTSGALRLPTGDVPVWVPVHGLHQLRNLAAAACAMRAVCGGWEPVVDVLAGARTRAWNSLTPGRGERRSLDAGGVVIGDAYNANPESMGAALAELAAIDAPGCPRIAVIGYMAELGDDATELHGDVGALAASSGIDELIVVGDRPEVDACARAWVGSQGGALRRYASVDQLMGCMDEWVDDRAVMLFKASNSVGLSRVADRVVERYGARGKLTPPSKGAPR